MNTGLPSRPSTQRRLDVGLPKTRLLPRPIEVAFHLNVSEREVRRLIENGEITAERHGGGVRIHRESVLDYLYRKEFVR